MKKNKWKIGRRTGDHLIEAVLIFASVFFAFWLTDYRESRKDAATLEVSLKHIVAELNYNHQRVERIYEYHSLLISGIDSLKVIDPSDWDKLPGEVLTNWEGIQIPMLRSTAYQTFLNSNIIGNLDFELAKSLADIYTAQSIIERLDNSIFEVVANDINLSDIPKIRHLAEIYTGILPDVMIQYQLGRKRWLDQYGYDMEIENEVLKRVEEQRTSMK